MSRMSYKTALRAKGIRPIPRDPAKLRSSLTVAGETIDATTMALNDRRRLAIVNLTPFAESLK